MAEVSRSLQSGVYRLSAFRNSRSRVECPGQTPGSLLGACMCSDNRVKEDLAQEQCEIQPEPKRRAAQRKPAKRCTDELSKRKEENVTFEIDLRRFIESVETLHFHQTAPYLSDRRQPVCQQRLLSRRLAYFTREGPPSIPDTSRSPQQLRAFCTVILILADQGSQRPRCLENLGCLNLHPYSSATSRNYSWSGDSGSTQTPLLYRSRTAYYDILNVSPGATQSQIKTAYYKQSFIYHPDKNPGSKDASLRFSMISEAYSVLGNIGLRRKYDRGILSQSDVQSAGRPSSKEATSRPTGFSQQQQQQHHHHHHQQRARRFSKAGGRTMFDFDAFYQAHYGEQLQKERDMRARKERMNEMEKQKLERWREGKMIQMAVSMLLAMAGLILINISKS